MELAGFSEVELNSSSNSDNEVTDIIVQHYRKLLNGEAKLGLEKLRTLRDKQLAHNELVEEFNAPTFKDLLALIDHAKTLVGIVGWGYMNMLFTHEGDYHLTADAERPMHSLMKLIDQLEGIEKQ